MGPYYDTRLMDEIGPERLTGITGDAPSQGMDFKGFGVLICLLLAAITLVDRPASMSVEPQEDALAQIAGLHSSLP